MSSHIRSAICADVQDGCTMALFAPFARKRPGRKTTKGLIRVPVCVPRLQRKEGSCRGRRKEAKDYNLLRVMQLTVKSYKSSVEVTPVFCIWQRFCFATAESFLASSAAGMCGQRSVGLWGFAIKSQMVQGSAGFLGPRV